MFQNTLDQEEGLLLVQRRESKSDASIHMLFVGMDLGIVWLNDSRIVVDKLIAKSWKLFYGPKEPARYVLEIHPDRLPDFELGDELSFEEIIAG